MADVYQSPTQHLLRTRCGVELEGGVDAMKTAGRRRRPRAHTCEVTVLPAGQSLVDRGLGQSADSSSPRESGRGRVSEWPGSSRDPFDVAGDLIAGTWPGARGMFHSTSATLSRARPIPRDDRLRRSPHPARDRERPAPSGATGRSRACRRIRARGEPSLAAPGRHNAGLPRAKSACGIAAYPGGRKPTSSHRRARRRSSHHEDPTESERIEQVM